MAGRGVDIILGGNPEGLAEREIRAGPRATTSSTRWTVDDGSRPRGQHAGLLDAEDCEQPRTQDKVKRLDRAASTCWAPSATRAAGSTTSSGAVSGRQGDPGESRFYLSPRRRPHAALRHRRHELGDGQGLPEDVPIESKMVTKADRAGPEHRRAAQRRDPQERPEVRRGHERAAQGDLRPPRPDARRARPARRDRSRPSPTWPTNSSPPTVSRSSTRPGTSRASSPNRRTYWPTELTVERPAEVRSHRRALRRAHGRGVWPLRGSGGRARRGRHAPDRTPGDAPADRPALA